MRPLRVNGRSVAVVTLAAAAALAPTAAVAAPSVLSVTSADYPPGTPTPSETPSVLPTESVKPSSPGKNKPEVKASEEALPRTGTEVLGWAAGGAALVLAGSGLVVATRRRHQGSHN